MCQLPARDGIERGLDPGDPNGANSYKMSVEDRAAAGIDTLPANLLDATVSWKTERCGPASHDPRRRLPRLLHRGRRREVQAAHEQITQWELDRYLQLY